MAVMEPKKNPPLSGNSGEGTWAGRNPDVSDIHSIAHTHGDFNSSDKFDIRLLKKVRGSDGQYTALCPAHDDRSSSLSVKITHDRVLLHCFAGCSPEAITGALGLPLSSLFLGEDKPKKARAKPRRTNTVAYDYLNPDGSLAYRKIRYEYGDGSKSFAFFAPDGKRGVKGIRRIPFNLPAVLSATTVYFVEGEKAAGAIIRAGRAATSLDAGANSKWLPEYSGYFKGKKIVILPDNDAPGIKYANAIARELPGAAVKKLPGLPEKGDVFDWLAAGRTMEEIDALPNEEPNEEPEDILDSTGDFLPDEPGFIAVNPFETGAARNRYRWNDIGISNLFADCYKNLSRYVPETKSWYVYDGRAWKQDIGGVRVAEQGKRFMYYLLITCLAYIDDDDKRSAWIEFAVRRMKKQARDSMLADAASSWPVSILAFDRDPYIFNCQNCTMDLKTFAVHEHSPDDFLSKISNVYYDPRVQCERWESFIGEIMSGDAETAEFLQKALGYALTGDTSEECFFILYGGTTRNGKGTTMETVLNILGEYGRTAQPETIAQKQITHSGGPSEDVARLKGARFVNMSEPDKGLKLNASLVKQLTGGDTVTARFLNQNSFEYRPEYKLFINTNHLPRVSDDSIFASGRIKLIPFERHFSENEQDKGLKAFFKQPENTSGIFNWLVDGLRLLQSKGLEQPAAIKSATDQYREDSDIVGQFIRECLVKIPAHKSLIKDVHAEYERWCQEYGYSPFNNRNLAAELKKKGLVINNSTGNRVYLFDYAIAED